MSSRGGSVRYRVRDGIICRTIGDELLLHCFDSDEVFVLNGDAKLVFEAVKEVGSGDEVKALVASRVFGDGVELEDEVGRALREMLNEGLIVVGQSGPAE